MKMKLFLRLMKLFCCCCCCFTLSFNAVSTTSNHNQTGYDIFTCCSEVFGSCRTSCENISLMQLAVTDMNGRDNKLGEMRKLCPSIQVEFWNCINQTLKAVVRGSQWSGRRCCHLSKSPRCQNACATSSIQEELIYGCRQSDEQHMFACFERQKAGDQCCSIARTSECLQACRKIFEDQKATPTKSTRKYLEEVCNSNNPKVLQCIKSAINLTPIMHSKQYLPCCELSSNIKCQKTCQSTLPNSEIMQEVIDDLEIGGCGPPLPHEPLWQCFLSGGKNALFPSSVLNGVSQINEIGIDSAKLHCCSKSIAPKCQRLCTQTFSTDWTSVRIDFETDCLSQSNEIKLKRCIDEVEEPCELGCDGLSFCTNFNNRPTELFRSCNVNADAAAKLDVNLWTNLGFVSLPGINLPIHNVTKCSPETWLAIACTLQIKPCTRGSHINQICKEDCYEILNNCMDWTRLEVGVTAASICSKLSSEEENLTDEDSTSCISLKPYLEPSDIPIDTGGHHNLTSPCRGAVCNATEICLPFRNATVGYQCVPSCPLGETSSFWVPFGAYVRIPVLAQQKGCLKICRCGEKGRIQHCQPLPCFSYDSCNLSGKKIEHGKWFHVECNICSCFFGEITCTKKQCRIPGISDQSYTSLPCNCPGHYVPFCGKNGNTYHSACIAKCTGLHDADLEFGACNLKDPCQEGHYLCPLGTKCIVDRKVCLSTMHRPCLQYQCVNDTSDCVDNSMPACDTSGHTHESVCDLFKAHKQFAHLGPCFQACRQSEGPVCGINGVTYPSECHAWSDYSYTDYPGECKDIGLGANMRSTRCKHVKCEPSPSEFCQNIVPPGACCPICSGAIRIIFSRKQIDRALYALKGKNLGLLSLKNILRSLDNLVQITECQLIGFLTMETDLFVAVLSRQLKPNNIQIAACTREAEKIATLIATQSHRITSDLILSPLTVANMVIPDLENSSPYYLQKSYIYMTFSQVFIWLLINSIF